ncbi:hypothetical protein [Pseudodonghicola flavimaris]|uniref:Argininosuccinate lyase n=1 Tax=Pseudodonghicola flavimaris TaxID=3050036 RepID=A0ABT7F825_9RHOB|nr:hypothetical protein [Pseudodonghicola flavimaris]MDK3020768.1 hypothetical protein [Pseudodonghicola flavimaris]
MKTYAIASAFLVLAHVVPTPTLAADRIVTIVNETGYTMVEFYGSNNGTTSWEEDILGDDTLPHGESVDVNFDDGTGHCIFDFLAVFEDGDQVKQEDVDVCKVGTFTFN